MICSLLLRYNSPLPSPTADIICEWFSKIAASTVGRAFSGAVDRALFEAFSICFLTELDRDSYPAVLALIAEFIGPDAKRMREPLRKPNAVGDGGRDHVQVGMTFKKS